MLSRGMRREAYTRWGRAALTSASGFPISLDMAELPFIDGHVRRIDASAERVWTALGATMDSCGGSQSMCSRLTMTHSATRARPGHLRVRKTINDGVRATAG